jgi:hypothetical protein
MATPSFSYDSSDFLKDTALSIEEAAAIAQGQDKNFFKSAHAIRHFARRATIALNVASDSLIKARNEIENLRYQLSTKNQASVGSFNPAEALKFVDRNQINAHADKARVEALEAATKLRQDVELLKKKLVSEYGRVSSAVEGVLENPNLPREARLDFKRLLDQVKNYQDTGSTKEEPDQPRDTLSGIFQIQAPDTTSPSGGQMVYDTTIPTPSSPQEITQGEIEDFIKSINEPEAL